MARIAVPRGPVAIGPARSAPVQSRVIALELHVPAGVGNSDYCYTPQLGNRLWLYSVDVWGYCAQPGAIRGGFFYFTYGTYEPSREEDVAVDWTTIIPLRCGQKPGFRWFSCQEIVRRFTMAKLFTNDGLRFGVVIENFGAQDWECTVAFEISEG